MKYLLLPLALGSLALSFTACDKEASSEKKAIENKADALDKQADAAKDNAKADAKSTEAAGEHKAKEIKSEADAVRDEKKDVKTP
jgi:hypothetical protein